MRAALRTMLALGLVSVVTPVASAGLVLATLIFLPLPATLPEASPTLDSRTSTMLDVTGAPIATFKEFETAIPVQPEDIPQVLKDAVVAQEDRDFYSHGGVDLRGTLRALWADIRSGESEQGGSTITQQYVRLAFQEVGTERTLARKIREAILASQLDRQVDKEDILFGYLSNVYIGEGAYGVGAAAQTYFRKNPRDLTLSEAALLVGVIPAPSAYSPRDNPESAETKRVIVLDHMLSEGYITPEQHADAVGRRIIFTYVGDPPDCSVLTCIYPPEVEQSTRQWFTDYVQRWLVGKIDDCFSVLDCPALTRGGLTIETTLDPRLQDAADAEVARVLDGTDPTLQMALVAVEPPTGFVRALVGGHDFAINSVNTALGVDGGGTDRSPGSAFKPFVLAEAFEQGIQPSAVYSGASHDVSEACGPQDPIGNYNGARYGSLPLRQATWNSVNTVYTRLILDVGVDQTIDMARRLGVALRSVGPGACASIALGGGSEVSPLEMASAYGVFANHGRRAVPTPVLRVLDHDGNLLIDLTDAADRAEQVIAEEVADNVTDVLRGVLTEGTASGRGINRPAAGKTGTSEDYGNASFIGFTPTLSTAVWMGYDSPLVPLEGIRGVGQVTGGSLPAQTWQRFMNEALRGVPVTEFTEPAPVPDVRDQALRERRGGYDPGARRAPAQPLGANGFVPDEGVPIVDAPPMTAPPTSSTSTTRPPPGTTTSTTFLLEP